MIEKIRSELEKGRSYKDQIGLYENVKRNENFFIGRQWEGVNAPDLPKPIINVLKRVVSYFVSMIIADDVGVGLTPTSADNEVVETADGEQLDSLELASGVLSEEIDKVFEHTRLSEKNREIIRDAAVAGDGYLYSYFEDGKIECELVDNTRIIFGNPHSSKIQKQPYILIEMRETLDAVKAEAKKNGFDADAIVVDGDERSFDISSLSGGELVTVIVRLWKEGGTVRAVKSTMQTLIRDEVDTGYKLYPVCGMSWDKIKNCCHGQAALTPMIPNQIEINKNAAMILHSIKNTAFPRLVYDRSRIAGELSNKPGQAIGVFGNVGEVVAMPIRGADMSPQVIEFFNLFTGKTAEFMGATDAALGNVRPDNMGAIIATQKAAAMPLELQRMAFYQYVEDAVRVFMEMMVVDYGPRKVNVEVGGVEYSGMFDFSKANIEAFELRVDIGATAYWSELMQIQTMDNLFAKGIIQDPITYLESIPPQYVRGHGNLLRKMKEQQQMPQGELPVTEMPVTQTLEGNIG